MTERKTTVDGKVVNVRTANMLKRAEQRLGRDLYVVQGSYNAGGVSASAGTHDGGGAIDVSATDRPDEVVRALREVGFAAWHRTANQGPWNEHIHAIAIGDPDLSTGARNQVTEYYNGFNGLAGNALDDGPRLDPIPTWPIKTPSVSLETIKKQFAANKPRQTAAVRRLQKLLNRRLGLSIATDGVAGEQTRAAWKQWERRIGSDKPDAAPGKTSVKKLIAGYYTLRK